MSKPFDATLKELVTNHPEDWLRQFGIPIIGTPEILNVDLSTVTASADTLIRTGELVAHIDIESGPDDDRARRMLLYNVLAHHHTGLPVHTVVVLLRPKAGDTADVVEYGDPDGCGLRFRFRVVRAWEVDAEEWLRGGIGLTPLAVLGRSSVGQTRLQALPAQVERINARAKQEAPDEVGILLTAAYILATMHIPAPVAKSIFIAVTAMNDLPGYQLIVEEGVVKGVRNLILTQGREKFGEPTERQANRLNAIEDADRLNRIGLRVLTAESWDSLLRVR